MAGAHFWRAAVVILAATTAHGADLAPRMACLPSDSLAVVEIGRPQPIMVALIEFATSGGGAELLQLMKPHDRSELEKLKQGVRYLESRLDTSWQAALGELLAGGFAVAAMPEGGVVAIIDANNRDLLDRLNQALVEIVQLRGQPSERDRHRNIPIWSFGGNEFHAITGHRLLLANKLTRLKQAIDLCREPGEAGLTRSAAFAQAKQSLSSELAAFAYVRLAALHKLPGPAARLNRPIDNPLAVLLAEPIAARLRTADWLAAGVRSTDQGARLEVVLPAARMAQTATHFAVPPAGQGTLPPIEVAGSIASLSLYRDIQAFYLAKDELFAERTSGLIFFENMMGIFFSGRELTSEVLSEACSDVRLVVARQDYDQEVGSPAVQLPAFGVVMRMKHPETFRITMEEAWQKAVGLANFTRGQKAQPGMIIDKVAHESTTFTVARFSASGEADRANLDVRFNFSPSLAMPGEYLILSSTEQLARQLIEAVGQSHQADAVQAGSDTALEFSLEPLLALLETNRETMIAQQMLEQGSSREEVAARFDALRALLGRLEGLGLVCGNGRDEYRATVDVRW